MAVEKFEVLASVKAYFDTHNRPCPKKEIIATYGDDGLIFLKELIDDGSLGCRRGRNGGYYAIAGNAAVEARQNEDAPIEAGNDPTSDDNASDGSNDLADQFAALEAKLARLSESESDNVLSE